MFSLDGRAVFIGSQTRKEWFPVVGEKVPYKIWFLLSFNNGFHQNKICSEKKNSRKFELDRKSVSTHRNEVFDKKSV